MSLRNLLNLSKAVRASLIALLFMAVTLWVTNMRLPFGGEKTLLQGYYIFLEKTGLAPEQPDLSDSLLLIDIHYDRQMVMEHNEYGDPVGMVPVTDRQKLYTLLQYLKRTDNYRYIMLDVLLDSAVSQPADTALYHLIASMPRIVLPTPPDGQLADTCLLPKTGTAYYSTAIWENDFVKYPLLSGHQQSMPLKMYTELTGRTLTPYGPLAIDRGLANRSVMLTYEMTDESNLYQLGWSILGEATYDDGTQGESMLTDDELARDRYVLIGDFEDDRHTTYAGELSGIIINFNAYLTLLRGYHRVSFPMLAIMFVLFWFLVRLTLSRRTWARVLMWMGYPIYLSLACILTYHLCHEVYNLLVTVILFYLLETLAEYRQHRRELISRLREIRLVYSDLRHGIPIYLRYYRRVIHHFTKTLTNKIRKMKHNNKARSILLVMAVTLASLTASAQSANTTYRIKEMNCPRIQVGGLWLKRGDILDRTKEVSWTHDRQWIRLEYAAANGRHQQLVLTRHGCQKHGAKTLAEYLIKDNSLGHRSTGTKHYSQRDFYLIDTLLVNTRSQADPNSRAEAIWTDDTQEIVTSLSRTADGKFYIITPAIYATKQPQDVKLTIREHDASIGLTDNVYHDLSVVYLPH